MIDLMMAFKECLGLVLLTGMITGYLFTLFSTKEEFKPTLNELHEKINYNKEQVKLLEDEQNHMTDQIGQEERMTQDLKAKVSDLSEQVKLHEGALQSVEAEKEKVEAEYISVASMLKTHTERKSQLQKEIGNDTVASLSEHLETQKQTLQKLESTLEKDRENLYDVQERHKRLQTQKEDLEAHRSTLMEKITQLEETLNKKKEKLHIYEEEILTQIDNLKEEANSWLAKIKKYKEELLKLKKS